MDRRFSDIFTDPENQIFKVVFFPDRIYHEMDLEATVSPRYRYNVRWVRSKHESTILKGEVYLDSRFVCNFLRIEYGARHLAEAVRAKGRLVGDHVVAWLRASHKDASRNGEGRVRLAFERCVDAYQCEIWGTLEPPDGTQHDNQVTALMGRDGTICRVKALDAALEDVRNIQTVELAYREDYVDPVLGYRIEDADAAWDNAFLRSHQVPNTPEPSSPQNTIQDDNYLVNFQNGWFLQTRDIQPVRYRNAMMDPGHPDAADDNIVEMRWIVQRELGGTLVYFHEVTVNPGSYEGTHRHIGSEELYYIVSGTGVAYMGLGDDPTTDAMPTVRQPVYGYDPPKKVKELQVKAGNVIYTKSGGIHGIRNPNSEPLVFVAFGYTAS